MSETITSIIAREKGISPKHVEATLNLLSDGATIPFISRYRKEATGGLDEVAVFDISQRAAELEELEKRKSYILATIEVQGNLSDELHQRINECTDLNLLEDILPPIQTQTAHTCPDCTRKGAGTIGKSHNVAKAPHTGRSRRTFCRQ